MTMNGGSTKTLHADPNVTPLIDVLLVLLIIFMVIVPVTPTGLAVALPQPAKNGEATPPQTIVVRVLATPAGPGYKINGETVPNKRQLLAELHRIFSIRAEKVVFVQGDPQLDFASIAEVIDLTRAAGIDHVGILTPSPRPRHTRSHPPTTPLNPRVIRTPALNAALDRLGIEVLGQRPRHQRGKLPV